MSRAVNLEVKLPSHVRPTDETTDALIKKFLKECSKESLMQLIYEKSAWTRRFIKRSDEERNRRLKYKRTAKRNNSELASEVDEAAKKKKKTDIRHQNTQKSD